MHLGNWPKCQKLHIYPLSTPGCRILPYFFSTGSGFRDTDHFSKLSYLGMKLGNWPNSRSCTYNLFLPQGVEIKLIFALRPAEDHRSEQDKTSQIWLFWLCARISETAARRAKISSISTPWGRKRLYVQLLALWPMAKFHAQIWQFWKLARISETAASRAKISSISTPEVEMEYMSNFSLLANGQVGSQTECQGPWASCLIL